MLAFSFLLKSTLWVKLMCFSVIINDDRRKLRRRADMLACFIKSLRKANLSNKMLIEVKIFTKVE